MLTIPMATRLACVVVFASMMGPVSSIRAEPITGFTTTGLLESFDSATPGTISGAVGVTGLQIGETLLGLDRRPANGVLYGLGSTSRLYTIDAASGVATQVGAAGAFTLNGTAFAFDFNPVVDRIRVVSNTGQDIRLNPNDGSLAATDTALSYATGDSNFGTTPREVGNAYTNNFAGATLTSLYGIDSNLDVLVTQGSLNGSPFSPNSGLLFTVGPLGFNTSDVVGFDISGLTGIAYASMTLPTGSTSQLFSINLATGAATLVGTIGGGVALVGLTLNSSRAAVPEPATLALLGFGLACLLTRRSTSLITVRQRAK